MLGIGGTEFWIVLVLAVLLLGPESLPALSRRVARIVYHWRRLVSSVGEELRAELGPEYADLRLDELDPRTLLRSALHEEPEAPASGQALTRPAGVPFDPDAT